jgi:outer membrane beta-barrel protein
MHKGLIIGWLVLAFGAPTGAQESQGLDLSAPARADEKKPKAEPAAPEQPAAKAPAKEKPAPAATTEGGTLFGERDVALGDRVKAVQRKGVLKRGRFEVAPMLALTLNDAFYQKVGGGLRLAYSIQDSFAVAVRGAYYTPFRTDNGREGRLAFQSQLLTSQPYAQAMLDGVWSPIYGKAAFLGDAIVHFDIFLSAGLGAVWSATSDAPRSEGPHPAAEFGGGVRFYPKDWMAFELGLLGTFYPDQPVVSVPATIQRVVVANVGVSFFFPTTFEYVYPQ